MIIIIIWHFTVANLPKTWVVQNLDNLASNYIRQWLDLPISATLSGINLSKNQFCLNLQLPSIKFAQCQTVCRNSLKSSPNIDIQNLWKNTSHGTNLQYDIYRNTKEVLKAVKSNNKERLSQNISGSYNYLPTESFTGKAERYLVKYTEQFA